MLLISLKNRCGQSNLQRLEVEKFAGDMLAVSLPVGQCLKLWLHSWEKRAGDAVLRALGTFWGDLVQVREKQQKPQNKSQPKSKKTCTKSLVKTSPRSGNLQTLMLHTSGVPVSFFFFPKKNTGEMLRMDAYCSRLGLQVGWFSDGIQLGVNFGLVDLWTDSNVDNVDCHLSVEISWNCYQLSNYQILSAFSFKLSCFLSLHKCCWHFEASIFFS